MIYEILLPLPICKTFYYEANDSYDNKKLKCVGKLVEVDFQNKKLIGLIIKVEDKNKFKKPLKKIIKVIEPFLFKNEILLSLKFISRYSCNHASMILKLFLSNFSSKIDFKETSTFDKSKKKSSELKLNSDQRFVVSSLAKITSSKFNVILLEGVTGSGKTRVYMNKVKEVVDRGLQCLILVPEIILTNQWVDEIQEYFGLNPEIYHSSKKKNEKERIWSLVNRNQIKLVVGTRSALFLPFAKLGLIVVDEEHDSSYKQEEQTIINARDFSIVRAKNSSCMIILSSATPSLESYHKINLKKFQYFSLPKRVNNLDLPEIKIIDMKNENEIISEELEQKIRNNIKKKHQTLIFINKRGYASFVICKTCGFTKTCKNCNSCLVLHDYSRDSYLLCHHCNYKEKFKDECPSCKTQNMLSFSGAGVEKISELVSNSFPYANVAVLSSDTIKNSKKFKSILTDIISNKIDIIIGTQLISKGHNFPSLKTVGIINIDNVLNDFDFRSSERVFQQVIQVGGRAGRKSLKGEVLIQTIQPNHPVIKLCKLQNIRNFANCELEIRKNNLQPPYTSYISIIFSAKLERKVKKFSAEISELIKKKFSDTQIFGPAPAILYKKNLNYRYRLLIKVKKRAIIQENIKDFLMKIKIPNGIKFYIDVDPINFI